MQPHKPPHEVKKKEKDQRGVDESTQDCFCSLGDSCGTNKIGKTNRRKKVRPMARFAGIAGIKEARQVWGKKNTRTNQKRNPNNIKVDLRPNDLHPSPDSILCCNSFN